MGRPATPSGTLALGSRVVRDGLAIAPRVGPLWGVFNGVGSIAQTFGFGKPWTVAHPAVGCICHPQVPDQPKGIRHHESPPIPSCYPAMRGRGVNRSRGSRWCEGHFDRNCSALPSPSVGRSIRLDSLSGTRWPGLKLRVALHISANDTSVRLDRCPFLRTAISFWFRDASGASHSYHCACSDLSTSGPYASGSLDLRT